MVIDKQFSFQSGVNAEFKKLDDENIFEGISNLTPTSKHLELATKNLL